MKDSIWFWPHRDSLNIIRAAAREAELKRLEERVKVLERQRKTLFRTLDKELEESK